MKKHYGATLIELVIYMALLSVFIVIMSQVFVSTVGLKVDASSYNSIEEDGRYILSRLMYDFSRSSSVTTPATIGSSGSQLSLVISGTTYNYNLVGSNLVLNNGVDSNNLNSSKTVISALNFLKVSDSHVQLSVTLESVDKVNGNSRVKSFVTILGSK
jgi:Tfp pilus assembly protein FimT